MRIKNSLASFLTAFGTMALAFPNMRRTCKKKFCETCAEELSHGKAKTNPMQPLLGAFALLSGIMLWGMFNSSSKE